MVPKSIELKGMHLNHDFYVAVAMVNNVALKMRRMITNTISLYELSNVLLLFICFKLVIGFNVLIFFLMKINYKINKISSISNNLKQMNNKRTLFNLYADIVLVTRLCFFSTNNNIKVVIQMHSFQFDPQSLDVCLSFV